MPLILITPLSAVPDAIKSHAPSHIVTLLSAQYMIETPQGFPKDRHLRLSVHDIADPQGDQAPARAHVERLLEFGRGWDASAPMLVHCWAGASRSTASAYAILCDRAGPGAERDIARRLRERAPHAQPNRLIVRLADDALGRGGAMVRAVDEIGTGVMVTEGYPVEMKLGDRMSDSAVPHVVSIGLSAAIVSVMDERPRVLAVHHRGIDDALPFGPFDPLSHRTLESGLRSWVKEQTYLDLGYAEQLYTFGDRGRHLVKAGEGPRVVSVGYLALTRAGAELKAPDTLWRDWYGFFPWEDWRKEKPRIVAETIAPALKSFVKSAATAAVAEQRRERVRLCFGADGSGWDEERVLERYELLYEAGLVQEAVRDGRSDASDGVPLGDGMVFDHRRILATAIARLRGKMKYRPVVFELMPPAFTLLELQRTVEAISGVRLHKQNFRRLVEAQGLVEGTGKSAAPARGRPAELFRFRREVLSERPAPGVRLGARGRGTA